jgi:hypothetical protein
LTYSWSNASRSRKPARPLRETALDRERQPSVRAEKHAFMVNAPGWVGVV